MKTTGLKNKYIMEPMNFFLSKEDRDQLKKLFETTHSPGFTILSETPLAEDTICVRVFFEDTIQMWYAIKMVEMNNGFERRYKEIVENARKKILENTEKLNQKLKNGD